MFKAMDKLMHNLLGIWKQELSPNFQLKWMDIWMKHRTMKEVGFLWALLHQALAINAWRVNTNQTLWWIVLLVSKCFLKHLCTNFGYAKGKKGMGDGFHNHVSVKTLLHMINTHKPLSL